MIDSKSIKLYFIPEEYREQIFSLVQSDDRDNWSLLYQLMVGLNNNKLSPFQLECYFRAILNQYMMNSKIYDSEGRSTDYYFELSIFLHTDKPYKK